MRNHYSDEATLGDTLVAFLLSAHSTREFYRIRRERVFARRSKASLHTTLSRLKKRGLVSNASDGWALTENGKKYAERHDRFSFIPSQFKKGAPAKCIVSFDVPQTHRNERDWLRSQLKIFGYTMLQQSLWSGPGPLPQKFKERLSELGIKNGVKIFTIA